MACSMVFGREPWVPGRMNPERGLPDWDSGLIPWLIPRLAVPGGLRSDVPGPKIYTKNLVKVVKNCYTHSIIFFLLAISAIALSSMNSSAIPSSSISTSSTYVCSVKARAFRNQAACVTNYSHSWSSSVCNHK